MLIKTSFLRYVKTDATIPNIVGLQCNVGSCCVFVGCCMQTDATTPNSTQHWTFNNMKQDVQTDATCNIQQYWELLANNVASVYTGLYEYYVTYPPWSFELQLNSAFFEGKIKISVIAAYYLLGLMPKVLHNISYIMYQYLKKRYWKNFSFWLITTPYLNFIFGIFQCSFFAKDIL